MFNLVLALLAGIVTIAAPCTLPVLPILLGASVGHTSRLRPAMIALGFVLSFSMVALALSAITRIFDFDPNVLRTGAAILLLGFGLLMIWPAPFEWLSIRVSGLVHGGSAALIPQGQGHFGGFVLGTTLGLVWTPCAGPVLGSILTLVATSKDVAWASALLVVYAIGAALPMLAIAYGGQAATTRVCSIARYTPQLQQAFGTVVIAFALASYFQYDTLIVAWLTGFYPQGQIGL
jgi:cytochrome c-type biogenesis protein